MKNHTLFLLIFSLFFMNVLFSQETEFKPSGKIIARAFMDYSNNFENENGFDISRAYLGYQYQILPSLKAQVILDGAAGKNSSGNQQVYLKNAFIEWNHENLTLSAGVLGLFQFKYQDKYSETLYIIKSFQDLNGMGTSADIGLTADYQFNSFLSADFSLTNGEGFKKIKKDDNMKYALGINFFPIKGMIFRIYGDIYNKSKSTENSKREDESALSFLTGYKNEKFSAGAEYSRLFNRDFIKGSNVYGYSLFANMKFAPKWKVFARYDQTDSQSPSYEEIKNGTEGNLILAGVEYQPIKQIKVAPNFRNFNYDGKDSKQYLFINIDINL